MTDSSSKFVIDGADVTSAKFSPAAVARMTGLSQDLQRVWRRRGQIPALAGPRASFNAFETAELFVRHQLSLYGVSPEVTAKTGAKAGRTALYFALLNVNGACEVNGVKGEVECFMSEFETDDSTAAKLATASEASRYLWRGDAGVFVFENDIQRIFGRERSISIACIDLAVLGSRLGTLAERPLFAVSLPTENGQRTVRQLTYAARDDLAE